MTDHPSEQRQPRNDRPWFQIQAGIIDSIDLNRLSADHERVFWRINAMCCKRGHGDTIHASPSEIAWALRRDEKSFRRALDALSTPGTDGLALIEYSETYLRIVKWHEYQPATTSSERSRVARAEQKQAARRQCDDDASTQVRRKRQRIGALEAEAEGEEEVEPDSPHMLPTTAERIATPVPRATRKTPVTDDQLRAVLAAWNRGSGQRLTWGARQMLPTEQIARHGPDLPDVERAAAAYVASLSRGFPPSFPRFAEQFDRWLSEADRPPEPILSDVTENNLAAARAALKRLEANG